jgi:hypothetical protein
MGKAEQRPLHIPFVQKRIREKVGLGEGGRELYAWSARAQTVNQFVKVSHLQGLAGFCLSLNRPHFAVF